MYLALRWTPEVGPKPVDVVLAENPELRELYTLTNDQAVWYEAAGGMRNPLLDAEAHVDDGETLGDPIGTEVSGLPRERFVAEIKSGRLASPSGGEEGG